MFSFFRKYQKPIISVVAFFIVISFAFFGIQGIITSYKNVEEKKIVTLSNQEELTDSDLWAMIRFLDTEFSYENPFNEGFLTQEFLETDLFSLILSKYPSLFSHLKKQKHRIQNYQPYVHPQGKAISAETVWKQFAPKVWEDLVSIRDENLPEQKLFENLKNLYLDQVSFSPQMLQRILHYLQTQYQWVQKDPFIAQGNFSLFGFRHISDWFGQDFLKIVSAYVFNYVSQTKDQMESISDEEVWKYLYKRLKTQYHGERISSEEMKQLFHRHIQTLGLSKKQLVHVTRTLLCYKESMHQLASNILVDLLPQLEMNQLNFTKAKFDKYVLPKYLQFHSFHDLELFEMYRKAISPVTSQQETTLPQSILPHDKIAENYPKLVYQKYQVKLKQISKEDLCLQIPLNNVFSWQVEDQNWNLLCKKFPSLKSETPRSKRCTSLDEMDSHKRMKIDRFSMRQMVQSHPEWIEDAYNHAKEEQRTFHIYADLQDGSFSTVPISKKKQLVSLLLKEPLHQEFSFHDTDQQYRMTLIKKEDQTYVSSFQQAREEGVLDGYLEEFLKKSYPSIQKIAPKEFITETGDWKPFLQVKDQLGRYAFLSLLKSIDQNVPIILKWKEGEGPLEHYIRYRFISDFQRLQEHQTLSSLKEFQLEKIEEELLSIEIPHEWIEKLQSLDEGHWSEPIFDQNQGLFVLNYKKRLEELPQMEAIGKKTLQNEMKQMYFEKKLTSYQQMIQTLLENTTL